MVFRFYQRIAGILIQFQKLNLKKKFENNFYLPFMRSREGQSSTRDLDSLRKSMIENWVPFFYILSESTSKIAKTANFGVDALFCVCKFRRFS